LADAELLYERGVAPDATYLFKHALIRQAAYDALLRSKRRQYHRKIAEVLQERFSDIVEVQPELLANHYAEAGLIEQAIPYWQKAGARAAQRSANMEAISHLSQGLELLKTLPDTPERSQQELALQTTLGSVLIGTNGYAAPETGEAYTRARKLCQQIGETAQLFPVLHGLWAFYVVRSDLKTARELAEEQLRLAESQHDTACLLEAHWALGSLLFGFGDLTAARAHLGQSSALYDPQEHRSLALLYGHDPGMSSLCFAAHALWHLGYPDQALKSTQKAVALAREVSHPY
jgi:predicted ATPase